MASRPPAPFPAGPSADSGGGSGGLRTAAIVGGSVLLGVGAVTGVLALSKKDSWSGQCDGKDCYASAKDDYDSGKLFANVSTGTFAVGVVFLTAGLFLIPGDESPKESGSAKPAVNVAAGPRGGFVSAQWVY